MKAVIGILVIFVGFFIEYSVFTGKIAQGALQPPTGPTLPTAQNTSSSFSGTTGQGSTSGNYGTYQPPAAGGYRPY